MEALRTLAASDRARIGRDIVARVCRELYANQLDLVEAIKWHHGLVMPRQLSWTRIAEESGIEIPLIHAVWFGKATPIQGRDYCDAVAVFRKKWDKAGRITFAETTYSRMIWEAFEVVAFSTSQGLPGKAYIRGDAGCGKTHVAKAWAQSNNHGRSVFYEPRGIGGTKQILNDLAALLGVDRKANYIKLAQRVFDSFEPGMVLIVDEVHLLVREKGNKQPLLDLIRRISDLTRCGLVVLATDDKFESDVSTSHWNDRQWWRRFDRIIDLPRRAEPGDIAALSDFKLPHQELPDLLAKALAEIEVHDKGGFGQVAKVLDDAILLARRQDRKPSTKDLALCVERKLAALDALARRSRHPRH